MSELTLIIGNKNYSSWSLRPWILLKHLDLPFREVVLPLDTQEFKDQIESYSPSGRVPVLKHGGLTVWDSLAICEYVTELAGGASAGGTATGRGLPKDKEARAVARAVSAEMHSGFINLRTEWPMNARARNRRPPTTPALDADVDRIEEIWAECRRRFGAGGPWLFGEYSIADAMFAPVVLRFHTYSAPLSEVARWYMATVLEDAALQDWLRAARDEPWTLAASEVGT